MLTSMTFHLLLFLFSSPCSSLLLNCLFIFSTVTATPSWLPFLLRLHPCASLFTAFLLLRQRRPPATPATTRLVTRIIVAAPHRAIAATAIADTTVAVAALTIVTATNATAAVTPVADPVPAALVAVTVTVTITTTTTAATTAAAALTVIIARVARRIERETNHTATQGLLRSVGGRGGTVRPLAPRVLAIR